MTSIQAIKKIQETYDINAIYAHTVFGLTKTPYFLDEAEKIISEKPKPFVKWVGGKRQLLRQFRLIYEPKLRYKIS